MTTNRILLIGECPPPYAGIAVQTIQLYKLLSNNNIGAKLIPTNQRRTGRFRFIDKLRVFRGIINLLQYLLRLIKIKNVDIVHILASSGLNFYIFVLPALVVSKLFNKKSIIHYHGGSANEFFKNKRFLLKISEKLSVRIVVPSNFLKDVFNGFGLKVDVIPNAVDLNLFKFRSRKIIRPIVLSARNLTPVYNVGCAINAFKILNDKKPGAKMIIAGDGPEKQDLICLAKSLDLADSITFTGNIPNERMPDLFNDADIFINTSNIDNMPISILEAQAMGLVVITTNPGGIPTIIQNKRNGLVTEINDVSALGQALIKATENNKLSQLLIGNGRDSVMKMDSQNVLSQWISLYTEVAPKN